MSESKITREVQLHFGPHPDKRLWRNNVGQLQTKEGTYVRYGLCVGSSDLIGLQSIVVTPDMVGKRLAVLVAIETKTMKGRAREEQVAFLNTVAQAGGLCGIARSIEDAERIFV